VSRSSRFLSGLSVGYAYLALVAVVGFVLGPFLLARLGKATWGLWLAAAQFTGYLGLLDLGTLGLIPRETGYARGEDARGQEAAGPAGRVQETAGKAIQLMLWQTPVVALAAGLAWLLLPERYAALKGPYSLVLAAFVLVFPARSFQAVLDGLQEFRFIGRAQMAAWSAGTSLMVLGVVRGYGLWALAAGWIATEASMAAACAWRLHRALPEGLRLRRSGRAEAATFLKKGLWITAGKLTHQLVMNSDLLIVGHFLGPEAVVPYSCTGKLIAVLANQPTMLLNTAGPGLAELKALREPERLRRARSALMRMTLVVSGALAVVVLAVNQSFVSRWIGPEQYGGRWLTLAMAATMLLRHLNTSMATAVFYAGYERRLTIASLVDAGVTVGVGAALCAVVGPIGVPLGSLVGGCLVGVPVNLVTLAGEERQPVLRTLADYWSPLWRLAVAGAIAVALGLQDVLPLTWPAIAALGAAAGAVYVLVIAPVALGPPVGDYLRPRLDALWRRVRGAFTAV